MNWGLFWIEEFYYNSENVRNHWCKFKYVQVAGQFEQPIEWQEPAVPAPNFAMDTVQMAKLRSELDVVQQNCKVMNEMLTEMIPNQESGEDWQLLQVGCVYCLFRFIYSLLI